MNNFAFTPSIASGAGFSVGPLEELRLMLRTLVGNGNLPGVVALLVRGDQIVMHEAFGYPDPASSNPLKTDAIFRLYSMTKPLTAAAMLALHEDGKWDFDDPLSNHLCEFRDFAAVPGNQAGREPTLREVFTHTSGHSLGPTRPEIAENIKRLDIFGSRSLTELIAKYASLPLAYEPGTRWQYSIAMDLQALIVERVSGQRFDRFLQDRILEPLGMMDTGFQLRQPQSDRLVPGFARDADANCLRFANDFEMGETIFPMGGTSFKSSALDYARFARMLLNRGSLGTTRVLKPESVDMMMQNHLPDSLLEAQHDCMHYVVGNGNGHGMNGLLCLDPTKARRPVGQGTYEWAGAHGTWFWADPENDILFVGMTNRMMPYPEIAPLSAISQDLVYQALRT